MEIGSMPLSLSPSLQHPGIYAPPCVHTRNTQYDRPLDFVQIFTILAPHDMPPASFYFVILSATFDHLLTPPASLHPSLRSHSQIRNTHIAATAYLQRSFLLLCQFRLPRRGS